MSRGQHGQHGTLITATAEKTSSTRIYLMNGATHEGLEDHEAREDFTGEGSPS